ncbi:transcription antitermination factor NusB [Vermiphilus pyriformis]|nr:MAG: transcription antitermination factor NusB [Vermiphilus pyriformis]
MDEIHSSNENSDLLLNYEDITDHRVRSLIFHLLYACDAYEYNVSLPSIIENFNKGFNLAIPLDGKIAHITQAIINERESLDTHIKPLLQRWRFERIGTITKLILRMAFWEMKNLDTPRSIVINEAIELSKAFGEKDSHRFINGVLDQKDKAI